MSRIPVADAHCDFLFYMNNDNWDIASPVPHQAIALPYYEKANVKLQLFAAWVDMDLKRSCLQQCLDLVDCYHRMLEAHPVFTPLTKDYSPESDKIATVLTIEDGAALQGELANLRLFHRLGVRAIALTWNYTNELASPAMKRANKGLTSLGRKMVKEMNRLGIAADVSHISDAGIDELLEISERPIFASHSNARSVCNHRRCLKDDHIKAIAEQGGVIGINFYSRQLTAAHTAGINDIVRHISHVAELVGPEYVCFGSDFDGMEYYPQDIKNAGDFPVLLAALEKAGFSEKEIRGIAYDNLRNYIVQFCD